MNLLITAGNTRVFIDRVRCLTNIFTGRTGAAIALAACARGHRVVLLTSHPETVASAEAPSACKERGTVVAYRTFADLENALAAHITSGNFDAVIHAAAVSDYLVGGIFAPAPDTHLDDELSWRSAAGPPTLLDRAAGKIKSDEPELWLRLTRAPKLVDRIRADWGFRGQLVKFKLEVGLTDAKLLEVAEQSRRHSQADWMVANTLESATAWAFLGPFADGYHKVSRQELPQQLLDVLEQAE
jgi:phosphopantothenate-cysteine ligase/phosphopantothenoylcysteine decarboxylase/phosphopantothenate--cysteine ligase